MGTSIASLYASVGADTGDFERKMGRVGSIIDGVGSTIGTFVQVGIGAAVAGLGAMAAGIGYSINKAMDFSQTMSGAQAVLQASGADMQKLSDLALQIGKDTKFSAQEAASAIEMLGQNGLTVSQIMDGAAKSTTDLAAATGVNLKTAADIASTAMQNFGIDAKDMAHAVDQMTGVTNASRLDMNDYAGAIAMAGGVAGSVGVSFEDFNAALAATAAAFSSGSDQGTSFKVFLQRLVPQSNAASDAMRKIGLFAGMTDKEMGKAEQKIAKYREQLAKLDPTSKNYTKRADELNKKIADLTASMQTGSNAFFDSEGNMKSMTDIAARLNQALSGLSDSERIDALSQIFGTDAQRFANALANAGAAGIQSALAIDANTKAADQAAIRMDNLAGDVEQFSGSLDTLAIKVGLAFGPLAREVVQFFTGEVNKLLDLDFSGFANAFDGYWQTVKGGLESGIELVKRLATDYQSGGFSAVLGDLGNTFEQWAANIWTVVSPHLSDMWSSLISWVTDPGKQTALWNGVTATWDFVVRWADYIAGATAPYLSKFWDWLTSWVTDSSKRTQMLGYLTDGWDWFTGWAGYVWESVSPKLNKVLENIGDWITSESTYSTIYNDIFSAWDWIWNWADYIWSAVSPRLSKLLSTLNKWLVDNYPQVQPWEQAMSKFVDDAANTWTKRWPEVTDSYQKFSNTITTETPKIIKNLNDLFGADKFTGADFAGGLIDAIKQVLAALAQLDQALAILTEQGVIIKEGVSALMAGDFQKYDELNQKANENWAKLFSSLGFSLTGGGLIGLLNGGKRASGGPVTAGKTYLTGEQGQELFVPQTSGYIYNAADTAAMMNGGKTMRIELAVTGESNLPMDRAKLRELARMLYGELNLSGAFLVTGP